MHSKYLMSSYERRTVMPCGWPAIQSSTATRVPPVAREADNAHHANENDNPPQEIITKSSILQTGQDQGKHRFLT